MIATQKQARLYIETFSINAPHVLLDFPLNVSVFFLSHIILRKLFIYKCGYIIPLQHVVKFSNRFIIKPWLGFGLG